MYVFFADITAAECFDALVKYCCAADAAPSWRVFRAFICFMEPVLSGFQSYSRYLQMVGTVIANADMKVLGQTFFRCAHKQSR